MLATVAVVGMNGKGLRIPFAMSWTTVSPHRDERHRFDNGEEARLRLEPWDETISVLVVYIQRELDCGYMVANLPGGHTAYKSLMCLLQRASGIHRTE